MLTYPYSLIPERVDDFLPPQYKVSIFKPDAGPESRLLKNKVGEDASITLTYQARRAGDVATFLDFLEACYVNQRSFLIPLDHKLWRAIAFVKAWHRMLETQTRVTGKEGALWRFDERPVITVPVKNLHDWKVKLINVIE